MMTPLWQIGPPGGPWQDAAAFGVADLVRRRVHAARDTVAFTVPARDADAPVLYPYGAVLEIRRAGARWFVGRVTRTPASADARAHRHACELAGPWWHLEHLVYRQSWTVRGGAGTALSGRLILGQAPDGGARTSGQVIADALDYAVAAGAPFQRGTVLDGFAIPLDQASDVTCAEVIRKMLRWHPDAVAWFDYSTDPLPTFHVRARGDLPAATLPYGAPTVRVGELTRHDELYAPAVVIHYETTGADDGQAYSDVATDAAPTGATGTEFGAVVLTIPLRGAVTTTVSQSLVVRPIPGSVGDPALLDYLKLKDPALVTLAAGPAARIEIVSCARRLTDPDAVEPDPAAVGRTRAVTHDPDLGNELVQGAVTPWMIGQYGVKAQQHTMDYQFTYTTADGATHGPFGRSVNLTATDAAFSFYAAVADQTAGDAPPPGLAAGYLASLAALQWSGSVVVEEALAGGAATAGAGLGSVVNLAGSRNADWAAMNAPVVEEIVEAATGRTTLVFGPARHLSPQDLVARLQTTRPGGAGGRQEVGALATAASGQRTSGRPGGMNDTVQNPLHTPTGGVSVLPGAGGA